MKHEVPVSGSPSLIIVVGYHVSILPHKLSPPLGSYSFMTGLCETNPAFEINLICLRLFRTVIYNNPKIVNFFELRKIAGHFLLKFIVITINFSMYE